MRQGILLRQVQPSGPTWRPDSRKTAMLGLLSWEKLGTNRPLFISSIARTWARRWSLTAGGEAIAGGIVPHLLPAWAVQFPPGLSSPGTPTCPGGYAGRSKHIALT